MIEINLNYQASLFANLSDINFNSDNTIRVLNLFREYELIPTMFQELTPFHPSPILRPQFASPNNEWVVRIATQRIDVEKNPINGLAENMGSLIEFTNRASVLINLFASEFGKKGKRIALRTNGLLENMEDEQLNRIYNTIFNPLRFYLNSQPKEWNTRSVSRINYEINSRMEMVNVITSISRIQGGLVQNNAPIQFDRISADFDINSIPENDNTRFEGTDLSQFYNKAIVTRNEILSEIEGVINGR